MHSSIACQKRGACPPSCDATDCEHTFAADCEDPHDDYFGDRDCDGNRSDRRCCGHCTCDGGGALCPHGDAVTDVDVPRVDAYDADDHDYHSDDVCGDGACDDANDGCGNNVVDPSACGEGHTDVYDHVVLVLLLVIIVTSVVIAVMVVLSMMIMMRMMVLFMVLHTMVVVVSMFIVILMVFWSLITILMMNCGCGHHEDAFYRARHHYHCFRGQPCHRHFHEYDIIIQSIIHLMITSTLVMYVLSSSRGS